MLSARRTGILIGWLLIGLGVGLVRGEDNGEKAIGVGAAKPKPGQVTPGAKVRKGRGYALLIGVNGYRHVPKLRYCAHDCELLGKVLVQQCGFPKDHVMVLADTRPETQYHPTRDNIMRYLDRWLKQPKTNDTVLVFFSGHGVEVKGVSYLVPIEARRQSIGQDAVSTLHVKQQLQRCSAARRVFVVDACHSGSGQTGAGTMSGQMWGALTDGKTSRGLVTLASCGMEEVSNEAAELRHGTFTYYLAKGLEGEADRDVEGNKDGKLTVTEVYAYTWDRVTTWAQRKSKRQTPKIIAEFQGVFVLAHLGSAGATPTGQTGTPSAGTTGESGTGTSAGDVRPPVVEQEELPRPPGPRPMPSGLVALPGAPVDPVSTLPTRVRRSCDGAVMLLVPAGRFTMGTRPDQIQAIASAFPGTDPKWLRDERPEHEVFLSAYYIDQFEVTNEQFGRFVETTGYKTVAEQSGLKSYVDDGKGNARLMPGAYWKAPDGPGSQAPPNNPVTHMTWYDAREYARWAGGGVPTEAQWEKAARGTDGRLYPWGNEWADTLCNRGEYDPTTKRIMGFAGDGFLRTAPVGFYKKNVSPFGCYDMAGNVWEWVYDRYRGGQYALGQWRNPRGPKKGKLRVLRGGSWAYIPTFVRCAARWRRAPNVPYNAQGFRAVIVP